MTPTTWAENPSGETDEYPYNSSDVYNSTVDNYDGVVSTDLADTEKTPSDWDDA